MKKIFYFLPILVMGLLLASCSKDTNYSDNLVLSTRSAEFDANGDNLTVTTKGDTWILTSVLLVTPNDTIPFDFEANGIDRLASSFTIKGLGYEVEKKNNTTLEVTMAGNPLPGERVLNIGFLQDNFVDNLVITQKNK